MNSLVWVIADSCRYDSFVRARTPNVDALMLMNGSSVERRYSYASWTAPSHYAFVTGLVPHRSATHVFASDVYKHEFAQWSRRLGIDGLEFSRFVPHLSLVRVLNELGYRTTARVSLPVLNEATAIARDFDDYRLMDSHNDFAGMIEEMTFSETQPSFYFLNLGETHYPYMLEDETLPRVSGVHGALKNLDRPTEGGKSLPLFDSVVMNRFREQQVRCVEYIDTLLPRLFAKCPAGTHFILTADHGELFGEDCYFGHGPIFHEKVFEVPFIEGKIPPGY